MSSFALDRRDFMKVTATAVAAATAAANVNPAAEAEEELDVRNHRPDRMTYRKLGKTNFLCSRLVFGCGAALAGGKAVRLLEQAYEAGINHYDVGFDDYYKGSEKNMAEFLKAHRDDVWVTSKAPARFGTGTEQEYTGEYSVENARLDAEYWTRELDKSLERMGIDYVDAYYLMAVGNPQAVASEELQNAFLRAKDAGKVGHFGISTHKRADECLRAAAAAGTYSLAMVAVTPGGWYDWDSKSLRDGTKSLIDLKPELDLAREAGIGLVGMKAARFIAPALALGKGDPTGFDKFYPADYLENDLSPFQRSYVYVLQHGMDVVNSDMQNFKHFEENVIAARTAAEYFA